MPNVGTRPAWHEAARERRALHRMLWEGTRQLRKEARTWLPPYDQENTEAEHGQRSSDYDQRIGMAYVPDFFRGAVERATNAIFARPITLDEDNPAQVLEWWKDLDLEGTEGNTFFCRTMSQALRDGMAHVLIDHQPGPIDGDLEGRRPYLVPVSADSLLDWVPGREAGALRAEEVRLLESETRRAPGEPFADPETVELVRVIRRGRGANEDAAMGILRGLDPKGDLFAASAALQEASPYATWELWEEVETEGGEDESEYVLVDIGWMRPFVEVPLETLVTAYDPDFGSILSPFDSLAHMEMAWIAKDASLSSSLSITLGATLHRAGVDIEAARRQRAISPRTVLLDENEGATAQWVERSGTSAEVAMRDLERIEERVRALANEPHVNRVGNQTATGRFIDDIDAKTEIQAWASELQRFARRCLRGMIAYREGLAVGGVDALGTVTVERPPRRVPDEAASLAFLVDLHRATGAPRLATILRQARDRGHLPEELDPEEEAALAEQEALR